MTLWPMLCKHLRLHRRKGCDIPEEERLRPRTFWLCDAAVILELRTSGLQATKDFSWVGVVMRCVILKSRCVVNLVMIL